MVEIDFNKENEEDFSDPPGFVDDVTDDVLVPDVLHKKPTIDEFEDNCVFIAGIPVVGADRLGKLQSVLKKVLERLDPAVKLYIPPSPEGGCLGVLLTEWADQRSAQFAVKSLNGYAFDKNHTFTARSFKDMKQLEAPSDHWTTPEKQAKTTLVPTVSLIPTFNTLISRRVRPTLLPTPLRKSRTAGETVRRIV
eukprot:NP_001022470.2 Eukaryotic translation initiation factor 3 subunit B [Caenorhabditis elegans]